MKKIILILFTLIILVGCGKTKKGEEIIFRKGIIYTISGKEPYTGYGSSYYDSDHIESEGNSKDGKSIGEWVHYYYNGNIKKKGAYINGKLEGEWNYYFHDGKFEGKASYKNGKEIK
jgi:antitoxin component YwqK of YwqJK toxin-antitoxin module